MSRNKYVLGLAGIISACVMNNACGGETNFDCNKNDWLEEVSISNPESFKLCTESDVRMNQQKKAIVNYFENLLKNECDKAEGYIEDIIKKDESGNPIREENRDSFIINNEWYIIIYDQPFIECNENISDNYFPIWRINLDNVCYAGLYNNRVLIESSEGIRITTNNLNEKVAEELNKAFNLYAQNNQTICEDYNKFIEKHFGSNEDETKIK